AHNPSSNLRLRSGIAPVLEMLRRGVHVAQGTDSTGINDDDDMLQEMALTMRLHRPPGLEELPISPHQVMHMATLGGARITMFEDSIGALEPGRKADMVLLDWDRVAAPYLDADLDPVEALIARGRARDVQTVIIGGQVVFHDGTFAGLDEQAIRNEITAQLSAAVP
ncbi:MAG: amidohydrolase family protein, partial [Chloroflexi bacterium]|nr:amidohydrolase family protein [Chloroflexota bacterium]